MTIDPCQPFATAVAGGLPVARVVVDHVHVLCLANAALNDVRHRTQHDTLGHGWPKDDPPLPDPPAAPGRTGA